MFDRKYLFDLLRNAPFGGSLLKAQVFAVGLILDSCMAMGLRKEYTAYILATAFHETGGKFGVSVENLNYSVAALKSKFSRSRISSADAERYGRKTGRPANQKAIANLIYGGEWGRKNLGNTQADDGWTYRGHGWPQLTGRRNFTLFGFASNPSAAAEIENTVKILVRGMVEGLFTGKKLSDFWSESTQTFDAVGARKTVNGTDKASLIAMHYEAFLAALTKSELHTASKALEKAASDVSEVKTDDVSAGESPVATGVYSGIIGTFLTGLVAAISSPWGAGVAVIALLIGALFLYGHMSGKLVFKR